MFGLIMKRIAHGTNSRHKRSARSASRRAGPRMEALEARVVLSNSGTTPYLQTNLVSDIPGLAQVTDSNLVNPWGVSFGPTSPFWVSNQGTSTSTLYAVTPTGISQVPLVVPIPKTASGPQGPTGQVFNNTSSFPVNGNPAFFIFASLNGTISAWNGGATAQIEWTTPGASYTGLAIASNTAGDFLYAADGAQNRINVFDGSFNPHDFGPNAFVDPQLPSGLVPFDVKAINGNLFVTYAPAGHANQTGAVAGQGAVAAFTTSGRFLSQLITGGALAAPWGITLAPAGFGTFSGDLLVGNFAYGDSDINAFDPSTGAFRGTLKDASGNTIFNPGLWTLTFGNGVNGGDPNTLYFTAGINSEKDGLFGSLQAIPSITSHGAHRAEPAQWCVSDLDDGTGQWRREPVRRRLRAAGLPHRRAAQPRRHPGLEFQQQRQPAGNRHHDRANRPERRRVALLPGPVHTRPTRADHRPGRPEERVRDRRQRAGDL